MKVTVKYRGVGSGADDWFDDVTKRQSKKIGGIVESAVKEGAEVTKFYISNSGTPKSGKRGRIETGLMRDSVRSSVPVKTRRTVVGIFGWIKTFKDYFGYQEEGFNHFSGVRVEGMYALTRAGDDMLKKVKKKIEEALKNA